MAPGSVIKGRTPVVIGDGQQAPLPRVEPGIGDHQLNERKRRRADTGDHDGSGVVIVLEDLIDCCAVWQIVEVGRGREPLPVRTVVEPRVHRKKAVSRE